MKRLQTILITGSLPVKISIVKSDSISPALGGEFLKNAWFVGLLSIIAVMVVLILRYKKWWLSFPIMLTCLSEVLLMLGFAALVRWNIDLSAIAGIIVAVGTGVDDQIVITDEALSKSSDVARNWVDRFKRAFFIILAAYFTATASMIPLLFAGAGLVKGFALTTIAGITFGVFVTRPAFGEFVRILVEYFEERKNN